MSKHSMGLYTNLDWNVIGAVLGIGVPKTPPRPVTGGLLHRMWRVDTEQGTYAVKVLNPEIMGRREAKHNYRVSERVAQAAYKKGVHAVPARMVGNEPWIEVSGSHFMVFDWIEGRTLLAGECTVSHARTIGDVLYGIHALHINVDGLELPTGEEVPIETWRGHIKRAKQRGVCWGVPWEYLLDEVVCWSRLYGEAVRNLSEQVVVSHRDLDSKNVIWSDEDVPYLIDWESTGYINPTVELVEVALNWSRLADGAADKKRFQAVITAYVHAGGVPRDEVSDAVHATLGGTLAWLEYNMRRSLDDEVFGTEERGLGTREVRHTIDALKRFTQTAPECITWANEILL
ncbi:aminoglycoside phosphotransferase family protein [Alicyclobacillus mengziensis]|uniref:Aminoglycoside phosphotransferase family protein n=1 Tax=Alicyclobacillus mengziensis TaxID=2931921 RepID=A0A9X7Z951_9BACL|nr:aminoglycoside phosphotransferase family protein [Alicyclobacillus mengziensis]QSO49218.1 aminoglycoside phosphotransferase family protein [Alicyclobacillus mengziensis]